MHEMALTHDVVDMVLEEAEKAGAVKVTSVTLTVGYVRDIVEDLFEGLFAWLTKGTVAEGAELILVRVPLMVQCNACGTVYHLDIRDPQTRPCPLCRESDYVVKTGMEFRVDDIDVITQEARAC